MSFYQSGNKQCFIFFISACIICSTVTAAVAGINAHQRTVIGFFLVIRFIICRLCLLFLFCHTADRFSGKSHCTDCSNHTGHHYSWSFQPVPFSFFYFFHFSSLQKQNAKLTPRLLEALDAPAWPFALTLQNIPPLADDRSHQNSSTPSLFLIFGLPAL